MRSVLRGFFAVLGAFLASGPLVACSGDAPAAAPPAATPAESAEEFARRAFAAFDAADSCPALEEARKEYLGPEALASFGRIVPCGPKVLAARYPVRSVQDFPRDRLDGPYSFPGSVLEADETLGVELDVEEYASADSFTFDAFLGSGWVLVTNDGDRRLFNTGIHLLDECLRVQDSCRFAG